MYTLLSIAVICFIPPTSPVEDSVDLIEVNHLYGENGKKMLTQVIFYDWSELTNRYQVRTWRLFKHKSQYPLRNFQHGGYQTLWYDGGLLRRVRCKIHNETWTQFDPELRERKFLPQDMRLNLSKPSSDMTKI